MIPTKAPSPMRRDLWRSPRPSPSKLDANARTTSLRKEGESNDDGLFATPRRGTGQKRTLSAEEEVVAATAKEPNATSTVAAMEASPPWRPVGDDLDDAAPSNLKRKREQPTVSIDEPSVERGGSADIAPRGVPQGYDQNRPGLGTTRQPLQTIRENPVDEPRVPLTTEQPRATTEEPSAHRRGSADGGRRGVPRGGHLDRAGTQPPPRATREPLQRVEENPVDQSGVLRSAVTQASQVAVTKPPAFLMYDPFGSKATDRFRSENPDTGRGSDPSNRNSPARTTTQPPDPKQVAFYSAGTAIAHARAKAKAAAAAAAADKVKRGRGRPKGARNKPKPYLIPEDEKREPWEEDPGVVGGPVRLWDHELEDGLDYLVEDGERWFLSPCQRVRRSARSARLRCKADHPWL